MTRGPRGQRKRFDSDRQVNDRQLPTTMSTTTTITTTSGHGPPISQSLRAIKEILQDATCLATCVQGGVTRRVRRLKFEFAGSR